MDDSNEVVVLFHRDDEVALRALFRSEGMRERLADARVKGQPETSALTVIDRKLATDPSA